MTLEFVVMLHGGKYSSCDIARLMWYKQMINSQNK